jgi:hypothetical protein
MGILIPYQVIIIKQLNDQNLVRCNMVWCANCHIENNTWVRGITRFISSVEHDISRMSAANE